MTNPVQKISINKKTDRIHLTEMLEKQSQQRGFKPMTLEPELLLGRIKQGGYSGQFLADAFFSAYRSEINFPHSLNGLLKLDAEALRLFHEILHIKLIAGWCDDYLYDIEQQIKKYQGCVL